MTEQRWDPTTPTTGMPAESSVTAGVPPGPGAPGSTAFPPPPPPAPRHSGEPWQGVERASSPTPQSTTSQVAAKGSQVIDRAGDEAAGVKEHVADAASEVKHQAGAELRSLEHDVKAQARDLVTEARHRVESRADETTNQVAGVLADTGRALTRMASRADDPDNAATEIVRQVGERTVRAAERLQTQGYQGVAQDLTRWARRRPGVFLVAAGAAGFLAGRLLRNADTSSIVDAAKGDDHSSGNSQTDHRARDLPGNFMPAEIELAEDDYRTVSAVPGNGYSTGMVR